MVSSKKIIDAIECIVVNIGVGKMRGQAQFEEKVLPEIVKELALITGQEPSPRPSRRSIAGFKVRQGDTVGLKVTLRGKRMADFFIRLIGIALPRTRDFRGLDLESVDGSGNLNVGIRDKSVFPEIDVDSSRVAFGFQATIVPKEKGRERAIDFYRSVGVPLRDHGKKISH